MVFLLYIYIYLLADHVQPPAKMFLQTIFKGGKAVNLTYQAYGCQDIKHFDMFTSKIEWWVMSSMPFV